MTNDNIAVASDHAGLDLKNALAMELRKIGLHVRDFGTTTADSCDYPDFAHEVAGDVPNSVERMR